MAGLLGSMVMAGCSTLPAPPTQTTASNASQQRIQRLQANQPFALEAKLAVQYAGKGYTARLEWQHDVQADTMHIFSPLGQQVALIQRTQQSVTLTDQSGKQHTATDVARPAYRFSAAATAAGTCSAGTAPRSSTFTDLITTWASLLATVGL